MTTALQKAIAGLYEAFACEPKPTAIDGCPCCIDQELVKVLLSKPLRSLTTDELSEYVLSLCPTIGSESDLRYFLPRILEILATEEGWPSPQIEWPGPQIVGKAIAESNWSQYTEVQQNSIHLFLREILLGLIQAKDGWAIDGWICGIVHCIPDMQPYLNLLEENPLALVAFYEKNSQALNKGRMGSIYRCGAPQKVKLLVDWFQSDRIKALINATHALK